MPPRDIYELSDELPDAIRAVRIEMRDTNNTVNRLEQTFDELAAAFRAEYDKLHLTSDEVVQLFEEKMRRLMAPFNERLSASSAS